MVPIVHVCEGQRGAWRPYYAILCYGAKTKHVLNIQHNQKWMEWGGVEYLRCGTLWSTITCMQAQVVGGQIPLHLAMTDVNGGGLQVKAWRLEASLKVVDTYALHVGSTLCGRKLFVMLPLSFEKRTRAQFPTIHL